MPSLGPAGRGGARRRTRRRMSRREGAASDSQSQTQAQAPAPASTDPMAELKKLGELHDAGVLTDAEFETKKAKLLSQI